MHALLARGLPDITKSNACNLDSKLVYCICKLQINGIARYYVAGEEISINLNMFSYIFMKSSGVWQSRGSYGVCVAVTQ